MNSTQTQKFAESMKRLRKLQKMSQEDLAKEVNSSKQVISRYESCQRSPKVDMADKIAKALGSDVATMLGSAGNPDIYQFPNITPIGKGSFVPLYGHISCGSPILAVEELEEVAWMPDGVNADFALTCDGDSMIGARIYDGDYVYIREQSMVDNGQIAAVIVRDEEVTLKRVYYYPERNELQLRAENPMYPTQTYIGEELDHVRILGKAVHFLAPVK